MKKKIAFGLLFLLLVFGALEAQYHFFLRANRYWSNAGVFSTDGIIQSVASGNKITMGGTANGINATGIFSNTILRAVVTTSSGFNIAWLDVTSTGTSGDLTGLRPRLNLDAASAGHNARGVYSEVIVGASKFAALAQGVLAHVSVAAGGATVTDTHVLGVHFSSGATFNATDLYGMHMTIQTRGDETISSDDVMLGLQNEAVGGTGRQMDSYIQFIGTNLSGGIKGATYLLDAGTVTDLVATAFMRLGDDEVMASVDHADKLNDISATANDGWIKVVIAGETKYIALYDEKTS